MRPSKGRTARVSLNLRPDIDKLLENEARRRGMSKIDVIESIILEWAYRNGHNKILHVNFRGNIITIWDFLLNQTVDLIFSEKDGELFCTYCKTNNCGHVFAASKLPEVRKKVRIDV